jgi:hypothetical protein
MGSFEISSCEHWPIRTIFAAEPRAKAIAVRGIT